MRLALFDLDNTLLTGDSDYEWGQFLVDHGVLEREVYEAQNRAYYEQYVAGTLDIHEYLGFALRPLAEHAAPEVRRVEEWLTGLGRSLQDFAESAFYSDSHNDLPLLERVTRPVAVDPDAALAAEATRRGWAVISLRR